jgi:hypothetical protein
MRGPAPVNDNRCSSVDPKTAKVEPFKRKSVMSAIDVRLELDTLLVVEKNESSADEPYLWVVYLQVDGTTLNLANLSASFVALNAPAGSHGNLGAASDGMELDEQAAIPAAIGRFDTTLVTNGLPQGIGETISFVAVAVVGLEEDGTSDSAAEAGHQAMINTMQTELNKAIKAGMPPDPSTITDQVQDAVKAAIKDASISVLSFLPISSLFDIAGIFDPDDFVGSAFAGPFTYQQIRNAGAAGIPFMFDLSEENSNNGNYRIAGRVRRLPFVAFAGLFDTGKGGQHFVLENDFSSFAKLWNNLGQQNPPVDMIDFDTYEEKGQRKFTGVFGPGKGGQDFVAGNDFATFSKHWTDLGKKNPPVDLIRVRTYVEGGQRKFAGLFGPGKGNQAFVAGDDFSTFVALWEKLGKQNPPADLIRIDSFQDGGQRRFVGVFGPGKGGQQLVANEDFTTFEKPWEDLGKQIPPLDMTDFTTWVTMDSIGLQECSAPAREARVSL